MKKFMAFVEIFVISAIAVGVICFTYYLLGG